MTTLNPERAKDFKSAYRICNVGPLEGEDLERYYVDLSHVRKTEAIEGVSTILEFQDVGQNSTILFTGHRGCGKSTELRRIQKRWEKDYHIIYLEINEETDIFDVNYTDLYLIVIKQVEYELRKLELSFDRHLLESFETWFKDVTQETEESVEKSVSLQGEVTLGANAPFIAKLLVKLLSIIKGSQKEKTIIRQTLEKDISKLKNDINLLLSDGHQKLKGKFPNCKGFLMLFDNLDRVPPIVGKHLFFDYASQLQDLTCNLIYTVPISVLCSPQNLSNTFGNPHIVPMVNIYKYERDEIYLIYNPDGLDAVANLIEKRVDIDVVFQSREELRLLAKASGGHVRQLMQMMRIACQTAATRKHLKIMMEDVEYAVKQEQFNFERFIPEEHYPILAQICKTKNVPKDETGQLMLFNTTVLEYNGKNRWNYVNPLVIQNDSFKTALKSLPN